MKPELLIRLMVGLVFLSEGIQKLLFPGSLGSGRFARLGIPYPNLTSYGIAALEIICSLCIIARYRITTAVLPLLGVMVGAIYFTKVPTLFHQGFWKVAHEGRTDFCMVLGLTFLLVTCRKD
jgi:uncharacterized membrane protein YphA (DoxX/SURF4 family)